MLIMNFSKIYQKEALAQKLKEKNCQAEELDCTAMTGTDCYCDDFAAENLQHLMEQHKLTDIHFIDSGNYHYVSKLWTDRIQQPFALVVLDHHTDMQPPAFGDILSCGGWIRAALEQNANLKQVLLVGVAEDLVDELKQTEASLLTETSPITEASFIYEERVTFLTAGMIERLENQQLYEQIEQILSVQGLPVYLSVDKDVLSAAQVQTNWDQGGMKTDRLLVLVQQLQKNFRLLGMDVCGEPRADCVCEAELCQSAEINCLLAGIWTGQLE